MAKAETKAAGGEDQSMEEILQSIRRIIAEENDGDTAAPQAAEAAPAKNSSPPPAPSAPEEVLELTEMVTENGAVISLRAEEPEESPEEPAAATSSDDILQNIDAMLPPAPEVAPESLPPLDIDSLLSPLAAEAASQAFKSIKKPQMAALSATESIAFRSGATVEDLMIELMKPMLKSWLDENLPPLVERIVEREVRKLTQ